jgi:hypothetical protein
MVATDRGVRHRGKLLSAMLFGRDRSKRPFVRSAFVGLVIAAATVTADLATYGGSLRVLRVVLFVLAGALAAAAVLLTHVQKKVRTSEPCARVASFSR